MTTTGNKRQLLLALDSNIFIAALSPHEQNSPMAQHLVREIAAGRFSALASSLVYGEVISVSKSAAALDIQDFLGQIVGLTVAPADSELCFKAGQLRLEHGSALKLPDALHLATALAHHADIFITNDIALVKIAKNVMPTMLLPEWQEQWG